MLTNKIFNASALKETASRRLPLGSAALLTIEETPVNRTTTILLLYNIINNV